MNNISSNISSNTLHKIPSVISIDSLSSIPSNKSHTPSNLPSDIIPIIPPNTPTNLSLDNINHHTSTDLNYINTQEIILAAPSIISNDIETNIPLYITPSSLLSSPLKRKLLSIVSFHPFELMENIFIVPSNILTNTSIIQSTVQARPPPEPPPEPPHT